MSADLTAAGPLGGFSVADAALLRAAMTAEQLRRVVGAYPTLADYLAAGPDAHAAAGVPSVTPPAEVPQVPDGGWVLALGGPGYPPQLAEAPHPPLLLFGLGDRASLRAGVAVVGTREASDLGRTAAAVAAGAAASVTAPVHSGMARGVDTAAHLAALAAGGPTVAVLASAADRPSPRGNAGLAARILAAGGAVLSEHPFGWEPTDRRAWGRWLQARNRIVAGLASTVVVCEAGLGSGTMGTVWAALAARRSVLVPLPRPHARSLPGAEALLALADQRPRTAEELTHLGCPRPLAETLAGRAPLAHGVARDRDELRELVVLAHQLSPLSARPAGDPAPTG